MGGMEEQWITAIKDFDYRVLNLPVCGGFSSVPLPTRIPVRIFSLQFNSNPHSRKVTAQQLPIKRP